MELVSEFVPNDPGPRVTSLVDEHNYSLNHRIGDVLKYPENVNTVKYLQIMKMNGNKKKILSCYQCKICSYKTKSPDIIRFHLKLHHAIQTTKKFNLSSATVGRYRSQTFKTGSLLSFEEKHKDSHQQLNLEVNLIPAVDKLTKPLKPEKKNRQKNTDGKRQKPHKQHKFSCFECPFVSKSRFCFYKHLKIEHAWDSNRRRGTNDFINCPYCIYRSKHRRYVLRHLRVHCRDDENSCYHCRNCEFQTMSPKVMHFHLMEHVKSSNATQKTNNNTTEEMPPPSLTRGHSSGSKLLNVAVDPCLSPQRCKCKKCDLHVLSLPEDFKPPSPRNSVTWYQCDNNDYKTRSYKSLEEHIFKKHVSAETVTCYKCELCSYRTTEKEELTSHVLEKHVDPQYSSWAECQMCLEKFKTDAELKKHIVTHIL